jgi:hypothetical protein
MGSKPANHDKAETIRRLIVGDLRRVFRHRYGAVLPHDDAGREDLVLLLLPISLCPKAPVEKMRHVIETLAPWLGSADATDLIGNLMRQAQRQRDGRAYQAHQRRTRASAGLANSAG